MEETKAPDESTSEEWAALPWRKLEQHQYRLQKRIFKASERGDLKTVHKLQKLLLKSRSARLLAVRRVTQDNQGKKTAGIDGIKSVQPAGRFAMVEAIHPKQMSKRKPKPLRRVWIPKPGKTEQRPLGIPVMIDRACQAVAKQALEPQWEAKFEANSYGFRPGRGAHDAIGAIFNNLRWQNKYVLDADIKGCFDKLNHELLLNILSEHIHDGRFINLMRDIFDAGYMEDWTLNQTLSGVPQGGIVSPILSNILLDKLDKFVETVLIPKYTKGDRRRQNPEYHQLKNKSQRKRQQGNVEEAEALRKQMQTLPSVDTSDPDYRRLKYVRYADDFLLGFIGPKSEAEEIKQDLRKFLQEELKLELSETKTLITHARDEAARFLGYEIVLLQDDQKRYQFQNGRDRRSINGRVGLRVPKDILEAKCQRYQKGSMVIHRAEMEHESDFTIISTYQLEFRGIANYYQLAYNMHTLKKLKWIMEISATKTLAHKFKVSVAKVYKRYGTELMVKGKKYKCLQVKIPRQDKDPLVAIWGGVPLVWDIKATLEEQPPKVYHGGHSELVQRLLAGYCELCGSTEEVEVHHVRAMKDLHEYPGREKPAWVRRMIALKRKTMPLCRTCHDDVHAGRPLKRQTIELTEVKALQKKAKTMILESRMR